MHVIILVRDRPYYLDTGDPSSPEVIKTEREMMVCDGEDHTPLLTFLFYLPLAIHFAHSNFYVTSLSNSWPSLLMITIPSGDLNS